MIIIIVLPSNSVWHGKQTLPQLMRTFTETLILSVIISSHHVSSLLLIAVRINLCRDA